MNRRCLSRRLAATELERLSTILGKNVVALCVAMHLPPWLSFKLIEKAGFALTETEEQQAFMTVLTCMFMKSIDEVDEYLKVRGNEPLVQVAA